MQELTIKKIIEITDGKLINGDESQIIDGFSKDTRTIKKGDLYIGIKGEKLDGNTYYKDAFEKGAIACLLDNDKLDKNELNKFKNIILVKNSIKAIQEIAKYKRNLYNIPVIAVTGSVGKTSTKDMIASILKQKYNVLKTEGNNNNHIGLPLTLLKLKEHNAIVVEMGMNHLGEIRILTNIAKPNICVITNIGTSHIGNLGSRENILKAKLEILEGIQEGGTLIINNDNDLLHEWHKNNEKDYDIKTYGIKNESTYMAEDIKLEEEKSNFDILIEGKKYNITVPVPGEPFIYNSLCGIAIGKLLNINMNNILDGIKNLELTKKRMEILKTKEGIKIINDTYNASLDSVKPAIEQLKIINGNKKIAVLGNMLELGEYSKELHEKVGEELVKNKIDILITVGDLAKYIAEKSSNLGMKTDCIFSFENLQQAIKKIKDIKKEGDVILLKASNSMHFNEIAEELMK